MDIYEFLLWLNLKKHLTDDICDITITIPLIRLIKELVISYRLSLEHSF